MPESERLVERMVKSLAHRGPDGGGLFASPDNAAVLGHRRLAIIDLSETADQPFVLEDAGLAMVFNGEIYNYVEIREELQAKGSRFRTESDTEVLLRAFEKWGPDCFAKLNGMFALGIWDRRTRQLILARDRYGKKPLYYTRVGSALAFASELKALRAANPAASTNPEALDCYLALGYIPAPLSILSGYSKLKPGHYAILSDAQFSEHQFYAATRVDAVGDESEAERLAQLSFKLREAVRIRFRADVEVGLFLSGGIDSSAVACASVELGYRPRALSIRFAEDRGDADAASHVARRLGLELETIDLSSVDLTGLVGDTASAFDEPFADSSAVPAYALAKECHRRFKVVLTGDGADECLGGYGHYRAVGIKQRLKRLAGVLRLVDSGEQWCSTYVQSKTLYRSAARARLLQRGDLTAGLTHFLGSDTRLIECPYPDALRRAMWIDRHLYLPDDLLVKMDTVLMRHSVEGRSPFLDPRLAEWTQSLRTEDLVGADGGKVLLRRMVSPTLGEFIARRPKRGFGSPIAAWLTGPLRELVLDTLPAVGLAASLQRHTIAEFYRRPTNKLAAQVWTLMSLALWERQWAKAA